MGLRLKLLLLLLVNEGRLLQLRRLHMLLWLILLKELLVCRRIRHHAWWVGRRLAIAIMIWRWRRGRNIVVYQLRRGDVAGLVLWVRDVRVLTGIGWWEAHRPDISCHQVKLSDVPNARDERSLTLSASGRRNSRRSADKRCDTKLYGFAQKVPKLRSASLSLCTSDYYTSKKGKTLYPESQMLPVTP